VFKEEAMKEALSRGRLLVLTLVSLSSLALIGCPLTDLEQATILQSTITTALTTVIDVILSTATGASLV
jgi:hypothetical protein